MINHSKTSSDQNHRQLVLLLLISLLNVLGFIYYIKFFINNGYLPSPFIHDKSDSFMDLFNTLFWSYDGGRYTEWLSVYPPFSFYILKFINIVFDGAGYGAPEFLRLESPYVIVGFCFIYLILPAILLLTRVWRDFTLHQKLLTYFAIVFSTPMLFALERGNMVVLCPIILSVVLSRIGFWRSLGIALLINIKPYFALLILYYFARQNWRGLVTSIILSGLVFVTLGLAIDENFLVFFRNLASFSQNEEVFSLREVMAMPSSISAFSATLKTADGAMFASSYINMAIIPIFVQIIEVVKWVAIILALTVTYKNASLIRDAEILALLVVVITNLGTWVGGYSIIFYAALIPVFNNMRFKWLYFALLALMALPLDIFALLVQYIGEQYSYLSNSYVDVRWTLGLGSIMRPITNMLLLLIIAYDLFCKNEKVCYNSVDQHNYVIKRHRLEIERI